MLVRSKDQKHVLISLFLCDPRNNSAVVCLAGNSGYNRKKTVNVENDAYDYGAMILIDLDPITLMIHELALF